MLDTAAAAAAICLSLCILGSPVIHVHSEEG